MVSRTKARSACASVLLLWAGGALAAGPLDLIPSPPAPEAKATVKATSAPAPEAIPLPRLVPAAVEAYRALETIGSRLPSEAAIEDRITPLDATAIVIEKAGAQLFSQPMDKVSDRDIVDFRQEMLRQDAQLARWSAKLEDTVKATYGAGKELERMATVWRLTEEQAAAEGAMPLLVERAQSVRKQIGELEAKVKDRLDRALAAQARVGTLRIEILGWMAAVDRADAAREEQLFEIESKPIWTLYSRREPMRDFGVQARRLLEHNVSAMAAFTREEGAGFLWLLVVFVLVVSFVGWAGRAFAARAAVDPDLAAPAEVLAHPISAGILVALSLTTWLLPRAPASFTELVVLAMLPPFLVLARNLLAPALRPPLYGFTGLYALVRFGALLPESSLPGRLVVLLVGLVGLVGALRMFRRGAPWTQVLESPRRRQQVRAGVGVIAVLLAAGLVANVVGNVSLARRLSDGSLSTGMIALLVAAVAVVLRALLVGAVRMPEFRRIPDAAENAELIIRRGKAVIDWLALLLWVVGTLHVFKIHTVVKDAVVSVLTARLQVGGLDVSLGDLVAFALTLWLSVQFARLLRVGLEAWLDREGRLPPGVAVAISKTVAYAVVGLGFLGSILASGMDVTRFTVILGTLSVGIGFGLQNVVNNFVSGLILLYERPIRVGDVIDVGSAAGTVSHIGIRSSTIMTFQGAEVVVPNSSLVSNQLTNWTLSDHVRRVEIEVGVAYGSDVVKVQEILVQAARAHADVLPSPEPLALFTGFGDSALAFQLRFWTARFDRHTVVGSDVRTSVSEMLATAGISIPFPQRDLHVVSVDEGAAQALRGAPPPGK
jgi:small-conductance mechanosensitive channel